MSLSNFLGCFFVAIRVLSGGSPRRVAFGSTALQQEQIVHIQLFQDHQRALIHTSRKMRNGHGLVHPVVVALACTVLGAQVMASSCRDDTIALFSNHNVSDAFHWYFDSMNLSVSTFRSQLQTASTGLRGRALSFDDSVKPLSRQLGYARIVSTATMNTMHWALQLALIPNQQVYSAPKMRCNLAIRAKQPCFVD